MDCVISVGVSILGKIGEYTIAPVGRQLGYLVYYKRNVTNLQTQIQQLRNAKTRMQHAVDEATRDAEGIEDDVQEWLCRVCNTINDAEVIQLEGESNPRHCNFMSRYKLSRKASKMAGEIHQLQEDQVTRFNKVSYRLTLQSAFKDKLFREFESRARILNGIMEALRDPNLSMVIVCGPGGIGKTMLAKEVARRTLGEKLCSNVVMVTISQSLDVEKVQQEIAEKLGLTLTETASSTRAERIHRRLEQEKEILLILDDVWNKFELAEVGITFGDDQKGCKILVTSRFQQLFFDDHMDAATKHFQVEFLSDAEATSLFNKIVGDSVEQPDFKVIAPEIIEECSGLPIAITTVASALRHKNLAVWHDALGQLRRNVVINVLGMEASVYKSVKLSYDFLRSEEAHLLLLFCSLRGEDSGSDIKFLLKYALGWGLFQDVHKLEEARDRVYARTYEVEARYLLYIDHYYRDCARMHDIIRDVVISIASTERKMHHIRYAADLRHMNDNFALEESVVIFVCDKQDDELLPDKLECPKLRFLFIDNRRVPDLFFEETKDLRVLDLNRVPLERLPSSICALQKLRTLCMWGCFRLRDITLIGELKSLEYLTIASCSIKMVPKQIGQLTRLRSLDLNNCTELEIIESGVISKLTKLEELNLLNVRIQWEFERVHGESINASLTEVKNLAKLTTLNLEVEDAYVLPENFFSDKLERYEISIGSDFDDGDLKKYERDTWNSKRILQLSLSGELPKDLEVLLKNSLLLYLDGLEGVSNFAYELDTKGFQQLKCLVLRNSNGIQYIVNSTEQTYSRSAFQSLELLVLRGMMKLEKICHGELRPGSFAKLQIIKVSSCDKLRNLFHYSITSCLSQLERIQVSDCKMMEAIVINEGKIVGSEIIFPQLHYLELKNVPKLSHYVSELWLPQSLTSPLFCGKLADPTSLMTLRELVLEDCSLKYLFSHSVAENLLQLNRLEIKNCSMLEEIIVMNQRVDKFLFPRLSLVKLENLPKLKRFCSGAVLEFPVLTEIKMNGCPELMDFRLHIRAQTLS